MKRLSVEAARVTLVDPPTELLRASPSSAWSDKARGIRSIIELYGSDGSLGIAETCGSPPSYVETKRLCRSLIGSNPLKIGEIHAMLRSSTPGGLDYVQAVIGGLENAIWDLVGRHLQAPLYELFGGRRPGLVLTPGVIWTGALNGDERLATRPTSDVVEATIARAKDLVREKGYEILLVIASGYGSELDAAILRGLREAFGSGMRLRLECFGAYDLADAARLLQEVEDLNLEYAANPVSTHIELEHLRRRIRTPLAIERAVEHHLAFAVRTDSAEVILGNSIEWGGIVPFRKNAAVCRAFALDMAVSSWNAVGPSIATALHLIPTHAVVNKGFHGVTANTAGFVVVGNSLLVHDGRMAVPDGPGIGIEIDRALLQVRKREEAFISTPVTAGADR